MSPRRLGVVLTFVVWAKASPDRRSRWADLPVGEAGDERRRDHEERDQQQQHPATGVGPSEHSCLAIQSMVSGRSGAPRTSGSASWPRPASSAWLPDRGLAAEPAQVRQQLLLALEQRVTLVRSVVDVVARSPRRGPTGPARRTRGRTRRRSRPARTAGGSSVAWLGRRHGSGAGRRATARRPPADAAGKEWRLGAGALVDGHPLLAHQVAEPRRARVHERERVRGGRRRGLVEAEVRAPPGSGAANPAHAARAGVARMNVDDSTGGACSRWHPPSRSFHGLDLPQSGGDALGGPQARAPRAGVVGDLGVRRGQRRPGHEAKPGRSGRRRRPAAPAGRCSPCRSASRNRLTIRSSSE